MSPFPTGSRPAPSREEQQTHPSASVLCSWGPGPTPRVSPPTLQLLGDRIRSPRAMGTGRGLRCPGPWGPAQNVQGLWLGAGLGIRSPGSFPCAPSLWCPQVQRRRAPRRPLCGERGCLLTPGAQGWVVGTGEGLGGSGAPSPPWVLEAQLFPQRAGRRPSNHVRILWDHCCRRDTV